MTWLVLTGARLLRACADRLWTWAARLDPPPDTLHDDAVIALIDRDVPPAVSTPTDDLVGTFHGRRGWTRPAPSTSKAW